MLLCGYLMRFSLPKPFSAGRLDELFHPKRTLVESPSSFYFVSEHPSSHFLSTNPWKRFLKGAKVVDDYVDPERPSRTEAMLDSLASNVPHPQARSFFTRYARHNFGEINEADADALLESLAQGYRMNELERQAMARYSAALA